MWMKQLGGRASGLVDGLGALRTFNGVAPPYNIRARRRTGVQVVTAHAFGRQRP